jgi:hypothetical protein
VEDAAIAYLKAVHDETKFYGTWLPGMRIEVGEVGRIDDDGVYRRATDLKQVGIEVETETFPYQDVDFATEGSVEVSGSGDAGLKGAVSVLVNAKGAFTIAFSSEDAVALVLRDIEVERVKDEERLRRDMLAAWRDTPRRLETDHVVITKVFRAPTGAIAMSQSSSARVELAASVGIAPGKLELADVKGKLAVVAQEGTRFAVTPKDGDPPLTPMFEMLHFTKNRPWNRFWKPVLGVGTRALAQVDLDDTDDPGGVVGLEALSPEPTPPAGPA